MSALIIIGIIFAFFLILAVVSANDAKKEAGYGPVDPVVAELRRQQLHNLIINSANRMADQAHHNTYHHNPTDRY